MSAVNPNSDDTLVNSEAYNPNPNSSASNNPVVTLGDCPIEIACQLLLRTPVRSINRFKSVSKEWRSLITSSFFVKLHQEFKLNRRDFSLIFNQPGGVSSSIVRTCSLGPLLNNSSAHVSTIAHTSQEIDIDIIGSLDGLVCIKAIIVETLVEVLYLWNPATKEVKRVSLPNVTAPYLYSIFGFGFDVTATDYKVVGVFIYFADDRVVCESYIYSSLTENWRSINDFPSSPLSAPLPLHGIYCTGVLYWLTNDPLRIIAFELAEEIYREIELPISASNSNYKCSLGLMVGEAGSQLVLKKFFDEYLELWVRVEPYETAWTELCVVPFLHNPIPYVPGPDEYQHSMPVCFSKEGELLVKRYTRFLLYEPTEISFKDCILHGFPGSLDEGQYLAVHMYMETLVSPRAKHQREEMVSKVKNEEKCVSAELSKEGRRADSNGEPAVAVTGRANSRGQPEVKGCAKSLTVLVPSKDVLIFGEVINEKENKPYFPVVSNARCTSNCGASFLELIESLVDGVDLSEPEVEALLDFLVNDANEALVSAFLILLRGGKGETYEEVVGLGRAMINHCKKKGLTDGLYIVGTGGNGAYTVNISTAASVLAAACGAKVAKQGNRSNSSTCGSEYVLEDLEPEAAKALQGFGMKRALLVHSEGLDETSPLVSAELSKEGRRADSNGEPAVAVTGRANWRGQPEVNGCAKSLTVLVPSKDVLIFGEVINDKENKPYFPAVSNARCTSNCGASFLELIESLVDGVDLSEPEVEALLDFLVNDANEALVSAFLILLRGGKGETYEEVSKALPRFGIKRALVVHSEGLDETSPLGRTTVSRQEDNKSMVSSSKPPYANANTDFNLTPVRPLSPPASVGPSVAPHPKSYMEQGNMSISSACGSKYELEYLEPELTCGRLDRWIVCNIKDVAGFRGDIVAGMMCGLAGI